MFLIIFVNHVTPLVKLVLVVLNVLVLPVTNSPTYTTNVV
jgi:hypothetical protein